MFDCQARFAATSSILPSGSATMRPAFSALRTAVSDTPRRRAYSRMEMPSLIDAKMRAGFADREPEVRRFANPANHPVLLRVRPGK